jgi:UDP-N-acetylmuramoylalanine--D-glutamate ligase
LKIAKNQSANHKLIYNNDCPFLKKINKNLIVKASSFSIDNIYSDIYYYEGYIYYKNNKVMKIKDEIKSFSYKISNYMVVVGVLKEFSFSNFEIRKSILSFKDVKYRLERLRYNIYNDAKSTNCASTTSAILGLDNVLLICGGYDRGIDIVLPEEALDRIVSVYAYGASKNKIKEFMDMYEIECHIYDNLGEAFDDAYNNLSNERTLLYSPMCASFDQYENYVKRAEEFERLVKSIK